MGTDGGQEEEMAKKDKERTNLGSIDKGRFQGGVLNEVYDAFDAAVAEIGHPAKQDIATAFCSLFAKLHPKQRNAVTLLLCGGNTEEEINLLLAHVDQIVTQEIAARLPAFQQTLDLLQKIGGPVDLAAKAQQRVAEEQQLRDAKGQRPRKAKEQ